MHKTVYLYSNFPNGGAYKMSIKNEYLLSVV